MSLAANTESSPSNIAETLHKLSTLPDWLAAAGSGTRVIAALEHSVAEFASGALTIRRCKVEHLRPKGEQWIARYELTITEATGPARELAISGTLTPPGGPVPEHEPSVGAFGTAEWRGSLPELGLNLRMDLAEEEEFEALPILTDPQQARAFLEQSIRAGAPAYADIAITSCTPKVMRNKTGRCTVRYQLEYAGNGSAHWPDMIIAKTYSNDTGQNAYTAMRKLWDSPLAQGNVVAIAEPLAYVPEQKVLVQGPVRGAGDLKDLLRAALRADAPDALEELHALTRKTAAGLAALHHSGARHGETLTWEDELAEIRGELDKLSASIPWFAGAVEPLLAQLVATSSDFPAEATLPAHRSFRPQQVLLDHSNIGFIDFDGFCLAEPALDIALFRATVKEIGINTSPAEKQKEFDYPSEQARLARLTELNTIGDIFLDEYARLAPISRQRVALWEALDLLTVLLHCWSKVKPHQVSNAVLLLESQLSASGLLKYRMDLNISTALSGSAGLAGLHWLLLEAPAHEVLLGALNNLLEGRATIGAIRLQRAKYKPGRYLTTYHAVELRSSGSTSTRLIEVNWLPPGGADPRGERAAMLAMQAEAAERGLATPFRALLAENPAWGMFVQIFPLDTDFPKLARLADPAYVQGVLEAEATVQPVASSYQITPIRYRPGQRHVLRYDPIDATGRVDEGGTLFAKVYNSDKGARTFDVAARISDWLAEQNNGISAVRPLTYIAAEGLVLYPRVVGTPLSELLRQPGPATDAHLRAAGAAIRALHQTPESLIALQPHSFAKELKGIVSASEHVRPLLPATSAAIAGLIERASALHEQLPQEPPAFAYGDFKADHLWVTPAGMTLIDFDTCYLSDPAIDLGKFLADLQWWYDGYGLDGVAAAQEQFLAGYGPTTPGRLARARLYEALVLTKSTVRRVKLFDPDWAPRTERLIDRATAVLDRLAAGDERTAM